MEELKLLTPIKFNGTKYRMSEITQAITTASGSGNSQDQFIVEEPKIMQIGSYSNSACNAKVLDANGICPTLLDHKGAEPAVFTKEPIKIRQATAQGYAECPAGGEFDAAHPNSKLRRGRVQDNGDVVGAITASADGHCVYEGAEVSILSYTRDDKGNVTSRHEKEIAGTLHTSTGSGGNTDQFVKTRYRIRKLSPRECFRLMDVSDSDIDKIDTYRIKVTQKSGTVKGKPIPKSAKYKLAGNSIVVSCLYHIFRQMFIAEPPEPKPIQKSLFDF